MVPQKTETFSQDLLECQQHNAVIADENVFNSGALKNYVLRCFNKLTNEKISGLKYSLSFTHNLTSFYYLSSVAVEPMTPELVNILTKTEGYPLCRKRELQHDKFSTTSILLIAALAILTALLIAVVYKKKFVL